MFKFRDAIKFPVLLFGRVDLLSLKGRIKINSQPKFGMVKWGHHSVAIFPKNIKSVINILGTVEFDNDAILGSGSRISVGPDSTLKIGKNFQITADSAVIASGKANVYFGDDCLISWECNILNTDFHKIYDESGSLINLPKDIVIGNRVWIGADVKILKGTNLTDDTIIGAGSVVSGKFNEAGCIIAGNPCRVIKKNIFWKH